MTRKYSLVIEGNEAGYSAYVPELPAILVTGKSIDELTDAPLKRFNCIGNICKVGRRLPHFDGRSK